MITGKNLIAGSWEQTVQSSIFHTVNPKTNQALPTAFQEATSDQIDTAVAAAEVSFETYASTSFEERATFLQTIQEELQSHQQFILETYQEESALPEGRAQGEFQRTLAQIQRFIELLQKGSLAEIKIYTQGPDFRKMNYPIGPIAVFGASNFPLAFSTAGGDTISALAAGCPVVVKAHPFHAGTSELVADCIAKALVKCNLPQGIFSHLGGQSHKIGSLLVSHPKIKGVGFTGSFSGGKALYDLAQKRKEPIPVFAEMGSINPIFIFENKLKTDFSLAETLAQSVTMGTGQFCTNPGLIVVCDPSGTHDLAAEISQHTSELSLPPMAHDSIQKKFDLQIDELKSEGKLKSVYSSGNCSAVVGSIDAKEFIKNKKLSEEVFGPFTLVVNCLSVSQMLEVAMALEGQLTATLLGEKEDNRDLKMLLSKLQSKVGRILFEGVPTGVAVTEAMQHGGPFPASTDSRFTSVGTDAIYRWLRPVAFQDCPNELLPDALKNENPLGILRNVDGNLTTAAL